MRTKAEDYLADVGIVRLEGQWTKPTIQQLGGLTPTQWVVVVDAIIDRTLPDPLSQELEELIDFNVLSHRWMERQQQEIVKMPPLLPWFVRGRA